MSSEDELQDIKKLLAQIRDQNAASAGTGGVNAADVQTYTQELKLARQELDGLEKGTGAFNRKQKQVESLTRQARNALKDQRDETDFLTLSTQGLTGALSMVTNAIDKVIVKAGEMVAAIMADAKALDSLTINFQAATGASAKMAANMGYLTDRLRLYGISNEQASGAITELYGNFTSFSRLNVDQQAEISRTVALMGELGVSFSASSQILESSTRTLGMSLGETESLIMDMRATSMALEVPIENLTRDFASAENMIAALGKTGPDAFNRLAAASKATGVEVGTLLGMVEQFDTFEGAASAVQGLNAVLGGNFLDSISMVQEVDPAKRFEMIRDAIFEAGHSVESLANSNDYYLKKSLAATLNLDVSTFMKALSGDVEELTGAVENASYSFEQMQKDAFGLKGFDEVVNGIMGSFKRPITEIQKASRAVFEGLTPTIGLFEKYNARLIDSTNAFVKKNAKLVGAVGLLYNLGNVDGVQKGYEIFKGIAGFTGNMLSNMFSLKGILLMIAGGGLFAIRKDLTSIYQTFKTGGFTAGMSALFDALKAKVKEFQTYLDTRFGINRGFVEKGLKAFAALAMEGFHYLNYHFLGPMKDYIVFDLLDDFKYMLKAIEPYVNNFITFLSNSIKRTMAQIFTGKSYSMLKSFGINLQGAPVPETETDAQKAARIAATKADNQRRRAGNLLTAQTKRKGAISDFTGTRGAGIITRDVNKAMGVVQHNMKKVSDAASKAIDSSVNAVSKVADDVIPAVAEGLARANIEAKVYVDGEQLSGTAARASMSVLNDTGRRAVLEGQ
jgi:hypothetical protein